MGVLTIKDLTKRYGSYTAVDGISFDLREGEILGLLGPNGAGKTTTIHMLLGLIIPDSGSVSYFGRDFFREKQYCLSRINFTSAFNTLQGRETVEENLTVFANLYGVDDPPGKIKRLADDFSATKLLGMRYKDMSTGQKTRVNFIKALINDPKILLMDEPTASLDPDVADKILGMIEELRREHKVSILYTSHNMKEVERICDRVIFLNYGSIVAQDTPLNLTKKIDQARLRMTFDAGRKKVAEFCEKKGYVYSFKGPNTVTVDTVEKLIPKIIFDFSGEGIWITDIEIEKPTLEDVFINFARNK